MLDDRGNVVRNQTGADRLWCTLSKLSHIQLEATDLSPQAQRDDNLSSLSTAEINRLTPNDTYMGRTAPLTSKRCILYIYSTNVGTEYFKHALYSSFFLFKMQFVS
jgi:hypothetical protein